MNKTPTRFNDSLPDCRLLKPTIFLFNGPPRSGKDTAAMMLSGLLRHKHRVPVAEYKFALPLKTAVHNLFGYNVPHDHFEGVKDTPSHEFFGMTPREAYIRLSEEMIKPEFGKDFFAKVGARWIFNQQKTVVVSDCGFQQEIDCVRELMPDVLVCLIRMRRNGCDFEHDSRSYLSNKSFSVDIDNNGSLENLKDELEFILTQVKGTVLC